LHGCTLRDAVAVTALLDAIRLGFTRSVMKAGEAGRGRSMWCVMAGLHQLM
jgi:hypothetical protein